MEFDNRVKVLRKEFWRKTWPHLPIRWSGRASNAEWEGVRGGDGSHQGKKKDFEVTSTSIGIEVEGLAIEIQRL